MEGLLSAACPVAWQTDEGKARALPGFSFAFYLPSSGLIVSSDASDRVGEPERKRQWN